MGTGLNAGSISSDAHLFGLRSSPIHKLQTLLALLAGWYFGLPRRSILL